MAPGDLFQIIYNRYPDVIISCEKGSLKRDREGRWVGRRDVKWMK